MNITPQSCLDTCATGSHTKPCNPSSNLEPRDELGSCPFVGDSICFADSRFFWWWLTLFLLPKNWQNWWALHSTRRSVVLQLRFIKWEFFTKKKYTVEHEFMKSTPRMGTWKIRSGVVTWNFILGFINLGPVMLVLLKSQIPGYTLFRKKKKVEIPGVKLSNYQKNGWISDELEKGWFTNLDLSMGVLGGFTL